MPPKKETASTSVTNRNVNTNHNVNNNTINNHIVMPATADKKPNWLLRAIVTGIISIVVGLAVYYGKQNINAQHHSTQDETPLTGTKQTKN